MTDVRPGKRRRASRGSGEQLHAEIVSATKELLARRASSEAVSIRAVADAVGVTAPAIYLHFADKESLIEAVVVDVLADLEAAMVAVAVGVDDPLARLCAYALAYVRFAISHPEHYRIATMERHAHAASEPLGDVDQVLADTAFSRMRETVDECIEVGVFASGEDAVALTFELWTTAHGLAALMVAKPYLPWGDKLDFAARTLRAAALGHAVSGLFTVDATAGELSAWLDRQRPSR